MILAKVTNHYVQFLIPAFPITGKDHQEAGPSSRVLEVQGKAPVPHQEDQALRVGRWQEKEGSDDPVLKCCVTLFYYYPLRHSCLYLQKKSMSRPVVRPNVFPFYIFRTVKIHLGWWHTRCYKEDQKWLLQQLILSVSHTVDHMALSGSSSSSTLCWLQMNSTLQTWPPWADGFKSRLTPLCLRVRIAMSGGMGQLFL